MSAPNRISAPLFGPDLLRGVRDRGVAGGAGLVLGQGAVRRAESQRQRQRLATLADLRARCTRRTAGHPPAARPRRPGPRRRRSARRPRRRRSGRCPGTPRETATPQAQATVSVSGIASRSTSTAHVPFGRPDLSMTAGCSWPAWPTTVSPTSTSAHRPGCHGRYCAGRSVNSTPAALPMMRTASNASLACTGRPGPHGPAGSRRPDSTSRRAPAGRGSEASSVAISLVAGPAVGRDQFDGTGIRCRLDDLLDREQSRVDRPAGYVAGQCFQHPRQQGGGQLRAGRTPAG